MKIKTKRADYDWVLKRKKPAHRRPVKPLFILTLVIRVLAFFELLKVKFTYTKTRMEMAGDGPYLILMNHSSFIDLKIASHIFFPKKYCIVCTSDGFVGKEWLMRLLGCIPTQKFVTDVSLIMDMMHAIKNKNVSVLMYPEASYSFDGCATPLPRKLGTLVKKLGVPVVTVITDGAFLYDPLYNCLQKRKVRVSAEVKCLLTADEIKEKSVSEIDELLDAEFTFDNFARQRDEKIAVTEGFRADGLHRILYKCAACGAEGSMVGSGTELSCAACGKRYYMDEFGQMKALNGETEFPHIPDWYRFERECVKRELKSGEYLLDCDVEIGIMTDFKAIYMVGDGHLVHDQNGFTLTGCDGRLNYSQGPLSSYGLYADYYWYEIGDVICIGDKKRLYYCFPKGQANVAKARIAAEELYKIKKAQK